MSRLTRSLALLAVALMLLVSGSDAHAQARFGLELDLGASAPLSASLRNVVALDATATEDGTLVGTPSLERRTNQLGFRFATTAHVGTFEFRYSFERFGWRNRLVDCVGDRSASQLPNGEVSDGEVRYQCTDNPDVQSLSSDGLVPLRLHHLTVGPRFYLRREPARSDADEQRQLARFYAVVGAGPTLALYRLPGLENLLRAGLHLSVGGGTEIPLERNVSLTLDVRYTVSLVGGSSSPAARAGRAIATQRGVAGALLDTFHQLGGTVGVRVDFR